MKVLLIDDFYSGSGGAERMAHSTGQILRLHGHEIENYPLLPGGRLSNQFFSIHHYCAVLKLIRTFSPDIVHFHNISRHLSASVLLAAARMRLPIVMTLHDFQVVCPKSSLTRKNRSRCEHGFGLRCFFSVCLPAQFPDTVYQGLKAAKLALHRLIMARTVHRFILPSKSLVDWVRKSFPGANVTLIPNFLMEGCGVSPLPRSHNLLYVGKLTEQKGVDVLIRALATLRSDVADIHLTIIGSGPELNYLLRLAGDLDLVGQVRFMGELPHDQVMHAYNEALCVVIPSRYAENCSLVGIEALAKGKVLVASDIGGLTDLVENSCNGFLVRPDDQDDLAKKILYIAQHPELQAVMGARARAKYESAFTGSAYYDNLLAIYHEAILDNGNHNLQL